jgi:hypothetical protein
MRRKSSSYIVPSIPTGISLKKSAFLAIQQKYPARSQKGTRYREAHQILSTVYAASVKGHHSKEKWSWMESIEATKALLLLHANK